MWVSRTPEEIARWQLVAEKEARTHGWTIALMAWGIAVLVLASGWVVSFSTGVAVGGSWGGTFWTRLPLFAVVGSPVIFIIHRYESRKAMRKAQSRTICPKCDVSGVGNSGAVCQCGGEFVPLSTVKWIEP